MTRAGREHSDSVYRSSHHVRRLFYTRLRPATNLGPLRPEKPYPDFPLFAHGSGHWAKRIKGRLCYFGRWGDPKEALRQYHEFLGGRPAERAQATPDDGRPEKPRADFPLFAHAAGQWAKKIKGRTYYFGRLGRPGRCREASTRNRRTALHAGRKPRADGEGLTVKQAVNQLPERQGSGPRRRRAHAPILARLQGRRPTSCRAVRQDPARCSTSTPRTLRLSETNWRRSGGRYNPRQRDPANPRASSSSLWTTG